tara:strand:+ start:650 stop:985 length:336 start_codon:yes stop_codon:yes gene_type:complete
MNLTKKIQLAANQNGFNVSITGDKKKFLFNNLGTHQRNNGRPDKIMVSDNNRIFSKLMTQLIQSRKESKGYKFINYKAGVEYACTIIDGEFKYILSQVCNSYLIMVYKINK